MRLTPIKTHTITFNESLLRILDKYITHLKEKSVIAITSKIVSMCEGRVVSLRTDKEALVKKEADACLENDPMPYGFRLTIKHHAILPMAGIDESNCWDGYLLLPEDPQKSAFQIWSHLRKKHRIKDLGVIITDSTTTPLRKGVTGLSIGFWGFEPVKSYVGAPDLFGRIMKVSQTNCVDGLAAAATFVAGEGAECTPIVLIEGVEKLVFTENEPDAHFIDPKDDIYAPLLINFSGS